jgi:DNA modification methylase
MASDWRILTGDVLDILRTLPDESVHCCVTSPPYWGLRDYGVAGQIGLEATPEAYVERMVEVFREVRRALRQDGTLWLNLGDSYAGSGRGMNGDGSPGRVGEKQASNAGSRLDLSGDIVRGKRISRGEGSGRWGGGDVNPGPGYKPKDLVGIPWQVAFALRADGWWLRSDIVWAKPNPMPESVTDRPTKAHEYIFLLAKSERYYYDAAAIQEECVNGDPNPPRGSKGVGERVNAGLRKQDMLGKQTYTGFNDHYEPRVSRNRRSVWTIATQPYSEAHFATFPPKLIEPCILAGAPEKCCPKCGAPWERVTEKGDLIPTGHGGSKKWTEVVKQYRGEKSTETSTFATGAVREKVTVGWQPTCSCPDNNGSGKGVVLDPFCGSGTTGVVALRHGRKFIGVELNPTYVEMAERRIIADAPLLNSEVM